MSTIAKQLLPYFHAMLDGDQVWFAEYEFTGGTYDSERTGEWIPAVIMAISRPSECNFQGGMLSLRRTDVGKDSTTYYTTYICRPEDVSLADPTVRATD